MKWNKANAGPLGYIYGCKELNSAITHINKSNNINLRTWTLFTNQTWIGEFKTLKAAKNAANGLGQTPAYQL